MLTAIRLDKHMSLDISTVSQIVSALYIIQLYEVYN